MPAVKNVGEPCAGEPHARFDGGREETSTSRAHPAAQRQAPPAYPTNLITVRGKGNRSERLPLPADVGEAITAYLQDGRPDSAQDRALFVRVKAPLGALSSTGVTGVVLHAARRAGLGEVRAHRLRHTAATQMLRAGGSLPEIGQLLRHRHVLTTAIYAKADREALREIARPWPGGRA